MTEINHLAGAEGGRWRVWTRDSSHIFDLDAMTVTRVPGAGAPPTVNDTTRPLRTIESCRVGERGAWTMGTEGSSETVDFFWHFSSEIRSIERLADEERADAER